MSRKMATSEFITKSKEIHKNNLIYDKTDLDNRDEKGRICVTCAIHGDFWARPDSILSGKGCRECSNDKKRNTLEQFIEKAKEIHGDKYDYSKVVYKENKKKVCIICPIHGEFEQTPANHLNGKGCDKCAHAALGRKKQLRKEDFIKRAKEIHGDKYDYSKIDLQHRNDKGEICITCPKHGEFWQTPHSHLSGRGCSKCKIEKIQEKFRLTNEEFIMKAKKIHGDDYIYDNVKYVNTTTPVIIKCPIHGNFEQKPFIHLSGCGCQECNQSHLEKEIKNFLLEHNIKFIQTANKKYISWIGKQHLDFYLPDYNIAIECQGRQHFVSDRYFGGDKEFKIVLDRDLKKYNLCNENGVKLLYFTNHRFMKYENSFFYYKNNLFDDMDIILTKIKHTD